MTARDGAVKPIAALRSVCVEASAGHDGLPAQILRDVSIDVHRGEIIGIIGETGAGKSMTAWSFSNLLPGTRISSGVVVVEDRDLLTLTERDLRSIRGRVIATIGQNPKGALHPLIPVGKQIANAYRAHHKVSRSQARTAAVDMLRHVQIADPERRFHAYPHELSGGMAQRCLIALAMVNEPAMLIADEPTTGLDSQTQLEILDLIERLVTTESSSVVIVSHDLALISRIAHRVVVMFAGEVIESGPTQSILRNPLHPYTRALVGSISGDPADRAMDRGGPPPPLTNRPPGCQFAYRCTAAKARCTSAPTPPLRQLNNIDDTSRRELRCPVVADQLKSTLPREARQ